MAFRKSAGDMSPVSPLPQYYVHDSQHNSKGVHYLIYPFVLEVEVSGWQHILIFELTRPAVDRSQVR